MKKTNKIIAVLAILVAGTMIATAALVPYLSNEVEAEITVSSPMVAGISLGRESWADAQCYRPAVNIPAYTPPGAEVLDWGYCSCDAGRAVNWGTSPMYTAKQIQECNDAADCEWFPTGGREANAPYTGGYVLSFPEGVKKWGDPIHDWHDDDWTTTGTLEIPDGYGGETITIYTMSKNLADAEIKGIKELIIESSGITCEDFVSVKVRTDSIYGELGYGKQHPRPDDAGKTNLLELCHFIDYNHIQFLSPCGLKRGYDTWGAGETDVAMWDITFMPNAVGTYTFTYQIVPVLVE